MNMTVGFARMARFLEKSRRHRHKVAEIADTIKNDGDHPAAGRAAA